MYAEATKVCSGPLCQGKDKPVSDFYRNSRKADGLQTYCKACHRHLKAIWISDPKNRALVNASTRRTRRPKPKCHKAIVLLGHCRRRAKKRGKDFSLTLEWVDERLLAGVCEVTGISFAMKGSRHPFMPSIDRIDSSKGYTPENSRVVLWMINAAKNDLAEDDFLSALRQVAEAVVERC